MNVARLRRPSDLAGTALAAILLTFAAPGWAADFQLDNVRIDLGKLVISAPKIAIKGSNLEKDAFLALFSGSGGESAAARAARLTASEISAPELSLIQTVGDQKQTTTYRDIRLTDVRDGKVGRGESAKGSITADGGATGPMKGELKRTAFDAFDLRQTARVLTEKAAPGSDEPMLPVIGNFEQDGYSLDMGKAGRMSLGKTTMRGFSAKVGTEPLLDVMNQLAAAAEETEKAERAEKDGKDAKPAGKSDAEKRLGLSVLALFDMFEYGSGETRDFAMTISASPEPGAKSESVDLKVARMAFGENAPAKSGFALEGLRFSSGPSKGGVDSISYSGFSFAPVLRELRAALSEPEKPLDEVDFRRFIPTIGTVRRAGITIDAPPILAGRDPVKIALGTFELKAGEQLNGIPTSLALTIDRLVTPIVEGSDNPAAKDMIAMGIRSLDLSAKLDLAWEAAKNEIAIRSLSLGSAGLVQLDASGTLGNVTKDLFSSDLALAQVAMLGATARGLQVKLQNFGLAEKLIENEARKSKRKVEEVRQQYAMIANLGLAAILGPSDAAKTLTAAVSRFVAKPGTLSVAASARSQNGLGLADVITMTEPTEIFDKINLKADAL